MSAGVVPGLLVTAIGAAAAATFSPIVAAVVVAAASYYIAKSFIGAAPQLPAVSNGLDAAVKTTTATPGTPMKMVYGQRLVGGNLVFAEISGDKNQYLHLVYGVCVGEINSIGTIYLNEKDAEGTDWLSTDPFVYRLNGVSPSVQTVVSTAATINGTTYKGNSGPRQVEYGGARKGTYTARGNLAIAVGRLVRAINLAEETYYTDIETGGRISTVTFKVYRKPQTPGLTVGVSAAVAHTVSTLDSPLSLVEITRFTGEENQSYVSALVSALPTSWTSAHTMAGIAGIYMRLRWEELAFPAGLPTATFVVNGLKVLDYRLTTWTERGSVLEPNDGADSDNFGVGCAVSDDGSLLVVGSYSWEGASGTDRGGVYTFIKTGSSWTQIGSVLEGENDSDHFGRSVALNGAGTVLIVGAEDWGSTYGNQGAVYTYDKSGTTWVQRGSRLIPGDIGGSWRFGSAVALSTNGARLVVGARDRSGTTTSGGAYTFDRNGSSWTQLGSALEPTDGANSDQFGISASLAGNGRFLVIGATSWEDSGTDRGGVYTYALTSSVWSQEGSVLEHPNPADSDWFGRGVALSNDTSFLAVGCMLDDDGASDGGAVYTFRNVDNVWEQQGSAIIAADASAFDYFGISVALTREARTLIVGAQLWEGASGNNRGGIYTLDTDSFTYSNNPALCIRDYLTNEHGADIPEKYLDNASFDAAATYCSAYVSTTSGGSSQSRYTCDGALFTDVTIKNNLDMMLSSCRGVLVFRAGKYYLIIDKPEASTFDLSEDHIVGNWTIAPASRQTRMNRVRANFIDPDRQWEAGVAIKDYASGRDLEDNGLILQRDIDLPFTTDFYTAKHIAHIEMKQSRQGIIAEFDAHASAVNIAPMDVGTITHATPGWTSKKFRVISTDMREDETVRIACIEYEETSYDLETLDAKDASPNTNLPDAYSASPVSALEAYSSTEYLVKDTLKSLVSRIFVTWSLPNDAFTTSYELVYFIVSGTDRSGTLPSFLETDASTLVGDYGRLFINDRNAVSQFIDGAVDGAKYHIMVRTKNTWGVTSNWAQIDHKVIGKTGVPSDVTVFTISIDDDRQVATWDLVPDIDVIKYEIRKGSIWGTATHIGYSDSNRLVLPQTDTGTQTYLIKAIDVLDQESTNALSAALGVTAAIVSGLITDIAGQKYVISWTAAKGSYPIEGYDIRYGVSWETGTRAAFINSNVFSVVPDWTGTRNFWVAAKDVFDNYSTAVNISAEIAIPGSAVMNVNTLGEDILLEWNMTPGTFAIKQFDLRRSAQTWASAESVGLFNVTSHRVKVNWEDDETFLLRGYDLLGNEGVITTFSAAVSKPSTPNVSHSFAGNTIILSWAAPASDINIVEYEIKRGETVDTYASATLIGSIKTTVFQEQVTFGGDKRYFVKAINAADIASDSGTTDVTISNPTVVIENIQVIDNNVLLYWTGTAGTLTVAHYNLYRSLDTETYASATSLGAKDGTFTSVFELTSADYTYYIEAQDAAGNVGAYVARNAKVNEPPDFVFQNEFNSTFASTKVNMFTQVDGALLFPVDTAISYSSHFVNNSWTTPSAQVASGFPIYAEPSLTSAQYQESFDMGAPIATSRVTVSKLFTIVDGDVSITPTIETRASTGASWETVSSTDWNGYATNFRYIRVTIDALASGQASLATLDNLDIRVDSKLVQESGSTYASINSARLHLGTGIGYAEVSGVTSHPTSAITVESYVRYDPEQNHGTWTSLYEYEEGSIGTRRYRFAIASVAAVSNFQVRVTHANVTRNYPINDPLVLSPLRDGLPHHFAFVFNGSETRTKVYMDGRFLTYTSTYGSQLAVTSGTVILGQNYTKSADIMQFKGDIEYVRVYSSGLTSAQVSGNFIAGQGAFLTSDLFSYYDMQDGSGVSITDNGGSNDLTMYGSASWVSADLGYRVFFSKTFIDINSVQVTPRNNEQNITAIVNFDDVPYPKSFMVYLFDQNGNRVEGKFSWLVRGFI